MRNKTEKLGDLLQFMWQPVVEWGPGLSVSTSPVFLPSDVPFGLISSPPQHCVLLRAETMMI